ncbi:MAG: dihydrolipoyl dehydrogenase [Calditrichaeota bacterium]|nr:dihydrolipoyl dehydrogenase [Calditrichota bacterium]MCB9365847.1 dihydrolipoyl dehydrogenase [Calditrichota bacterium]
MKYDLAVIGSGPGGYVAAIRAAQLKMKVAIIERYSTLGGTCLNVGCIPSKALLDSSELYLQAEKHFGVHGIGVSSLKLDWDTMRGRKDKVVEDNVKGVAFLMKKNKIDVHTGHATLLGSGKIAIAAGDGKHTEIEAANVIIATGSKPADLPFAKLDKERIISSTEALALKSVPKELVIIGAGVIGCEMGSVFARLGTKVRIVEYLNSAIPTMDGTMGKELGKSLKNIGIELYLGHKVKSVESKGKKAKVVCETPSGEDIELTGDYCLMAVGRRPYTDKLGLENVKISTDQRGFIKVNENLETAQPGIFAIGDVIGGAMLAHKAEEEGVFVAERLAGQKPHINYRAIPWVVYTWPEVAGVGYTEEELKQVGREYKVGSFPYKALGRARAANESEGVVKVLADKKNDEVLGVHIFGARAADMIAEAVVALEFRASAEDIARMSHAHPTFTEAMKEACLSATENRAIHL